MPPAPPGLHWAAQFPLGTLPALSSHSVRYKAGVNSIVPAAVGEDIVRSLAAAVEEDTVHSLAADQEVLCTLDAAVEEDTVYPLAADQEVLCTLAAAAAAAVEEEAVRTLGPVIVMVVAH